ncbi:MAG TPA: lyase [Burkholderiaceae bacterium]|nr:lyase [Burkholderiaceae bacterium]
MLAVPAAAQSVRYYDLPSRSGPHDVAPAPDGTVWYTAQRTGRLGRLDPRTGKVDEIPLGRLSAPHGVIVGPDGAAWVTDGGQNAIVRVDPATRAVKVFPLPAGTPYANLNTAAFDGNGVLWWTGQSGYYGSVNPKTGEVRAMEAPRGRGPYGITATPKGEIYYVSLAGNHLAHIDTSTGVATVIEPPTPQQGARRVWSDSKGRLWISEWVSGQVSMYDPASKQWKAWRPSEQSQIYAVYVDDHDKVWLTEWSSNAILRFDPETEKFQRFPSDKSNAQVRQMLGRTGEAWGAESGTDRLVVISTK